MKKTLLMLTVAAAACSASAADYPYLVFQSTGGVEKAVAVESLTLIVSDGQLLAVNESGTQSFTLTELNKMYFSQTATGIETIDTQSLVGDEKAEIYDLSGRRVVRPVGRGVYVIKKNGVVRKISLK